MKRLDEYILMFALLPEERRFIGREIQRRLLKQKADDEGILLHCLGSPEILIFLDIREQQ